MLSPNWGLPTLPAILLAGSICALISVHASSAGNEVRLRISDTAPVVAFLTYGDSR